MESEINKLLIATEKISTSGHFSNMNNTIWINKMVQSFKVIFYQDDSHKSLHSSSYGTIF